MADESSEKTGLALGIEKIGLLSLNYPIPTAIVAVLVVIGAVFGVMRLKVDDSLSELFRTEFSTVDGRAARKAA